MNPAQTVPQAPAPPTPEMVVQGSLEGWELALLLLVVFGAIIAIAWPFLRSLAGRLDRPAVEPEVLARLVRVEGALHHLRTLEDRVADLEERLDFAERFLPRPDGGKDREALPPTQRVPGSS